MSTNGLRTCRRGIFAWWIPKAYAWSTPQLRFIIVLASVGLTHSWLMVCGWEYLSGFAPPQVYYFVLLCSNNCKCSDSLLLLFLPVKRGQRYLGISCKRITVVASENMCRERYDERSSGHILFVIPAGTCPRLVCTWCIYLPWRVIWAPLRLQVNAFRPSVSSTRS